MYRRRRSALLHVVAVLVLAACGSGASPDPTQPGPGAPASISRLDGDGQQATVSTAFATAPTVVVRDAEGQGVPGVNVVFQVVEGDGWVVRPTVVTDASGTAGTIWYAGPAAGAQNRLRVSAAGTLHTEFTALAEATTAGETYAGANGYVEYLPGDIPVIVSAPHGGTLQPASIPNRTGTGITTVRDADTEELARDIREAFRTTSGGTPHVVIMRLHRLKVDANREIVEAAQGNPDAERAWREFHGFIEAARAAVVAEGRPGIYIDLHGHGHDIQRLELGYRLTAADLHQPDDILNSPSMVQKSSMRAHVQATGAAHADVIRGDGSLGTLFEAAGFPSVPSRQQPHPGGAPFFSGGYNTNRHASADGNLITGLQIEANRQGVRDTQENRQRFAAALAEVLAEWNPGLLPAAATSGQAWRLREPWEPRSPLRAMDGGR